MRSAESAGLCHRPTAAERPLSPLPSPGVPNKGDGAVSKQPARGVERSSDLSTPSAYRSPRLGPGRYPLPRLDCGVVRACMYGFVNASVLRGFDLLVSLGH